MEFGLKHRMESVEVVGIVGGGWSCRQAESAEGGIVGPDLEKKKAYPSV